MSILVHFQLQLQHLKCLAELLFPNIFNLPLFKSFKCSDQLSGPGRLIHVCVRRQKIIYNVLSVTNVKKVQQLAGHQSDSQCNQAVLLFMKLVVQLTLS
jgi:hypothetical protein